MKTPHWMRILSTWIFSPASLCAIEIGENAPVIGKPVPDQNEQMVDLDEILATGFTLVYFYPKADTPGCKKQGCSVRDNDNRLAQAGVRVIGVSADSATAQAAFAEKFSFSFTLIADHQRNVISAFGVPTLLFGMPKRQAFLFNDGKLVWKNEAVSPTTMVDEVLTARTALGDPQ